MLQNARVRAFTVAELLKENQREGVKLHPLTQIRVKFISPRISFQNRIDNKYFSRPIFSVIPTKNIFILSNSNSIINFKFRSFMIRFNFFQSKQNNHR